MDGEEHLPCEECGKRRATVHLTEMQDGQPVQHHICQECYEQKEGGLSQAAVLAHLVAAVAPELKELASQHCPDCGINYLEFRQNLRLGCPRDYEAFDKALEQLLERIHGSSEHCGKVPVGADKGSRKQSLLKLQQQAIADEDYELAAELRDRIADLEEHNGPDEPEE
jgi:protein arginine kinase activator